MNRAKLLNKMQQMTMTSNYEYILNELWIHYLFRYIQKIENEEMEILLVKKKMIELSPKGIYIKFLF